MEVALLALLATLVAGAYGIYAWRNAKEDAFSNLDNLALMSARSSALFFRHFELSLKSLSQSITATRKGLDTPQVHGLLMRFQENDERLAASNLYSVRGDSLASSNLAPGEHIPVARANPSLQASLKESLDTPGLQIGRPVPGMTGLYLGKLVIPMRYAHRDQTGKPLFVVTAAIPMSRQQEIWEPVSLPEGAAIGLLRDDGVLQGRWPEVGGPAYSRPMKSFLYDKLLAEDFPESGRAEGTGTLVREHRLIAFHRVPGYPLTTFVAVSRSVLLKYWIHDVWMPFLLFLLMAGCSAWIYRYASRQRAMWEQELQARQVGLEFRNEISAHAIQGLAAEEIVRVVVIAAGRRFQGMWCAYSTLDAAGRLNIRESSQPPGVPSLKGWTLDVSVCPAHLAALRQEMPLSVAQAGSDPVFAQIENAMRPHKTVSVVNVPLPHPDDTLGVLSVGSFDARVWTENEIALLSEIAVYLSFAMKESHAKRERENALAQLRESEQRFRDLTTLSSDWYWEQDENLRFVGASVGISQKLGYVPSDMVGKTRRELPENIFSDEQWNAHQAVLDARLPFHDFTFKRLTPEGQTRWVSLSGKPIFDEQGRFRGYRGIGKDVTDSKFAEERIQYLAFHDDLTTLPNRTKFSQILNHGIQGAQRSHTGLAVLFIDLDRFKNINDTLGHEAGDALLRETGERLRACVRQGDTVARLGGDEFVVLLCELGDPEGAAAVARKILAEITRPFDIRGQDLRVSASMGISLYPEDGTDEQTLMKRADIAMYHAKESGRNNYQFHTAQMDTHSFERLAMESSLRGALERGEFQLHYQPKVDLRTGRVTGMEALIRWQHRDLGVVSPAKFIPIAEETGLIVPIGKWVLNTACRQNKAWQDQGLASLCVAVNLSARQFSDETLLADIADTLTQTGLAPAFLELEITESMIMRDVNQAVQILDRLKGMGIRLAIDDFGTGYSSLSNIKRFPLDTIKVDRSFISDIPGDADDKAITSAIIAMGRSLGLTVVAEGVETREQIDYLIEHACDQYQGYYFSKPVDARRFEDLLRSRTQDSGRGTVAA